MTETENAVLLEYTLKGGQILRVVRGDITIEEVDAIVNAANERLMHGGGVAGAISRKSGGIVQEESDVWVRQHGPVVTGSAAITSAGRLPAKYVIHAVGPVWGSGNEEEKLADAVNNALSLADAHHLKGISIPGISSGIFGGPKDICARVIVQSAVEYLKQHPDSSLEEVRFCNIDETTASAFVQATQSLLAIRS
ncbi:MAG: macro domain-containing protein [Anaerolineae bacterium]|nr:macro domain-containing protein [Anaerolineae bacterium]